MQRIQILMTIKPDGTVEEKVLSTGHGLNCVKASQDIEQHLGQVGDRQLTDDYLESLDSESDYVQMFEDLTQ
ncbi:DUF2997 domain-containing protein [Laspinema olomoucense]|uniref:DUF2997 domain-containing protein n=1 Tax=Laspinema olomoucense D3b TaxID=2953688 RepID=A0ABT2N4S4_9CYAN|nr:DUF2997 domain-containing protein [Laspinema sp. D3b]MCT7977582.1 DUF2997 domain-containing protein [Laspinema sp. D3b]